MAKYSKKAQAKVKKVMDEWKEGKLKTGSGKRVTNQKQAVAIGISEARAEGDKVPAEKPTAKKSTSKGNPEKKSAAKKTYARKSPAKKAAK